VTSSVSGNSRTVPRVRHRRAESNWEPVTWEKNLGGSCCVRGRLKTLAPISGSPVSRWGERRPLRETAAAAQYRPRQRCALAGDGAELTAATTACRQRSPLVTCCVNNVSRYHDCVLRSFRDKDTEAIWHRQRSRRLDGPVQRIAWRKLAMLDAAETLTDLLIPPGNRLEKLTGDRAGQHSIRINQQWRICFTWSDAGPEHVEIVDYH
jgi:toxin HigB-1